DAGNVFIYYATGSPVLNNNIARINAAFTGTVWLTPSTFSTFNELGNKNAYVAAGIGNSNGFNCLGVSNNYLYFYNGFNLAAYSKTTGAILGSTTIPGNIVKRQGGIGVDDCDNVYVGGNGTIAAFNFNGTTFTSIGS